MPIWSQVCLVPVAVLFTLLLPVHPTVLLPARRQFPNGIEWVSSWLSILPQRKPILLVFFFSFLWISHSWQVAGSPCFPSIECSFQLLFSNHWLNMHVCVFFSQHCHTVSYTLLQGKEHPGGRARRGFSVEIQHMWLRALKQNNKPFPPAACGLLLGSWVIKLRNFQPVSNQSLP